MESTKRAALMFRQECALMRTLPTLPWRVPVSTAVPSLPCSSPHLLGSVATHQLAAKADGNLCQTVVRRGIDRDREAVDEVLHCRVAGPSGKSHRPVVCSFGLHSAQETRQDAVPYLSSIAPGQEQG